MSASKATDFLVVGGGVMGLSIGYGLAIAGETVRVLDEGDIAFRASRGNGGLIWVQGKGVGKPAYASWTMAAVKRWPEFAARLFDETGVDVELSQIGGLHICLSDAELANRVKGMESLRAALDDYPYEVLDRAELAKLCPMIGPEVVGGMFCPLDGHVSPLRLLRALVAGFKKAGGLLMVDAAATEISHGQGLFTVKTKRGEFSATRIVLASGLGNLALAPQLGMNAHVEPIRGQMLVTERVQPFLRHPWHAIRQTREGVVQLGASKEDVGFDDGTSLDGLAAITQRAIRCFPLLAQVNVVRSWGALRPMTPDGYPLYQQSATHRGAFAVNCHSGITLASEHAGGLVDWLRGRVAPAAISEFNEERFNVQTAQ
ncbi:NAD(P)/FAD-dependent oxidoreductase [Roseateles flavus]|uniref:FAD-dependent oxidoreductase n=1 Tax=Roseateles flavus TaxID=3149041 RepID=A0ABV0GKJ8_9BURK